MQQIETEDLCQLVREAQQGQAVAFAEVCRRFEGLVVKHAFAPHIRPIGEDARSEGRLAVVEAVSSYREASGVPFAGYVESRVRYRMWNLFKKERRRWRQEVWLDSERPEEDAGVNIAASVENQMLVDEVQQAIGELPDKQRLVITATVLGEARLLEVAQTLGVSVQAVHKLRCRALARLRSMLEPPVGEIVNTGCQGLKTGKQWNVSE